jgi:TonB family protein
MVQEARLALVGVAGDGGPRRKRPDPAHWYDGTVENAKRIPKAWRVVACFVLGCAAAHAGGEPVTLESLERRLDEAAASVLERIGAEPAQCPVDYVAGWDGRATLLCGHVEGRPKQIRRLRSTIVDELRGAGIELDEAVGSGSSWITPPRRSFDVRSFVLGFLPVQVVVDPGRGNVALSYPAPIEARDTTFEPLEPVDDSRDLRHPRLLRRLRPEVPEPARRSRRSGDVVITGIVGRDGRVREVEIRRVDPQGFGFEQAAEDALRGWLYAPATLDGTPIDFGFTATISFTIR